MRYLKYFSNITAVFGAIYLLFVLIPHLISSKDVVEFGVGVVFCLIFLTAFVSMGIDFYNEYYSKKVKKND